VQSLVRMQDMPRSAKIDLQSRLSAMAAMHEHIYRHDRYEDIDASELIPVVVDEVVHAYGTGAEVVYDIDHVAVDRDHVTPLSLLLSELVTNALKYAFADGRDGTITVTVRDRDNGRCDLVVADNGVGFGPMSETPASMGLRLIRGVVSQMGGSYGFVNENGTRFEANLALASAGHAATKPQPAPAAV
jgi:two-component sensor histidine kinase